MRRSEGEDLGEKDEAKILAGGHSLLAMMKLRFAEPEHLIDINGIEELKGVREEGGAIHIGSMVTENELIASDLLEQKCPLLPEAARQISDPQVRNLGTIGGDIAHGDPANDHSAIAMALDATFVLQGPGGERSVPPNGFFPGTFWTEWGEDEILKTMQVPVFSPGAGSAYFKLKRKTGDFATAATPNWPTRVTIWLSIGPRGILAADNLLAIPLLLQLRGGVGPNVVGRSVKPRAKARLA